MSTCELTGVGSTVKNRVSHSNIKTKIRVLPNVTYKSVYSTALGARFTLKISAAALKSLEHQGGFDKFILGSKPEKLSRKALLIRNRIVRKLRAKTSSPSQKTDSLGAPQS